MKKVKLLSLGAMLTLTLGVFSPVASAMDDITGSEPTTTESSGFEGFDTGSDGRDVGDVGDAFKRYQPVNKEDLEAARQKSSGLRSIISFVASIIIYATFLFIGLITALDILYISVPWFRPWLFTAGTSGTGGMAGGFGMSVGNAQGRQSLGGIQWVSDEAVQVASMLGGESQSLGHGGMAGGGFGGGGFGGGGFGAQSGASQQAGGKSAIGAYLKKRIVFLFLLGVSMVLLFTSAFTDFGINVGGLLLELLGWLMGWVNSFSIG